MGCATEEDFANPTEIDSEDRPYLTVGKDGNTTDLTFGHYAGLVSFALNEVGIPSVELSIYNMGVKTSGAFSAKGDSGSLIWHMKNGEAFIVGQLHSGSNKGGSTSKLHPGLVLTAPDQEGVQVRRLLPHHLVRLRTTSSAFALHLRPCVITFGRSSVDSNRKLRSELNLSAFGIWNAEGELRRRLAAGSWQRGYREKQ